jgi:hypothetical protein
MRLVLLFLGAICFVSSLALPTLIRRGQFSTVLRLTSILTNLKFTRGHTLTARSTHPLLPVLCCIELLCEPQWLHKWIACLLRHRVLRFAEEHQK